MRKEVEEIVATKLKEREEGANQSTDSLNVLADKTKEQKIEGDDASIVGLLQELLNETKGQNKLLSNNNKSSTTLNFILMFFSGITLVFALASIQIASLQLLEDKYPLGETIFYFVFFYAMILVIILGIMLIRDASKDKNHPVITKFCNIILAILISSLIIIPFILIILGIFPQLDQITFIVIVSVIYGVICGVIYYSNYIK